MRNSLEVMHRAADNLRILEVAMIEKAKSGHPGGSMGGSDVLNVLYSEFLVYDPEDGSWPYRDRFFLDPGHQSAMLYGVLALAGLIEREELPTFRQWGSRLTGHPELNRAMGVENTSGPLGQGHCYAIGAAIAAKHLAESLHNPFFAEEKIYAYMSDGSVQEEVSQGGGRIAGLLGLNNLIAIYDSNDVQLSTLCGVVSSEDTAMKYRSWGWHVLSIDGNDVEAIRGALDEARKQTEKPTLIICATTMGKGARTAEGASLEHSIKTHGAPLGKGAYEATVRNLGGDVDDPFRIWDDVQQIYTDRRKELMEICKKRRAEVEVWAERHPVEARKVDEWFGGKTAMIDWSKVELKPNEATRTASASVLGVLAEQVENMICSSADLCNSDKTEGFLKKTRNMCRGDLGGRFLQAGVSELTMVCLGIGIVLHGGMEMAMGTFFVFSDYMKPAIRMAALMELPIKYVWTHDSFRVGEDGPTHQPIEQEAQIRLLERMTNRSGKPSMLVLRPADGRETLVCWQVAMENRESPSGLILSRQKVDDLPGNNVTAENIRRGAYVVRQTEGGVPEIVLIGSGSEVSTLSKAMDLLEKKGHRMRLVSIPSEGLFRLQPAAYQAEILPKGIKRFGLVAGLSVCLENLLNDGDEVFGVNHFGVSAPAGVLDEKFGFTPEQVASRIEEALKRRKE